MKKSILALLPLLASLPGCIPGGFHHPNQYYMGDNLTWYNAYQDILAEIPDYSYDTDFYRPPTKKTWKRKKIHADVDGHNNFQEFSTSAPGYNSYTSQWHSSQDVTQTTNSEKFYVYF